MAYNTKYRFWFENGHGVDYRIYLEEDGYSGSIISRPLGKAPVLRMQENGPFRSTSLDLVLECQTEGEYVSLYTTDPRKYRVSLWKYNPNSSNVLLWRGYVATEIYSEPDIAPPYDVRITATDGLGVLKEYDYEHGIRTVVGYLDYLLGMTGLSLDLWAVSLIKATGSTVPNFFDNTKIDLDYMDGKSCYEVLEELLTTLRLVVTQWRGNWIVIRETDISVASNGNVAGYDLSGSPSSAIGITNMTAKVGKMGASGTDMWPVNYLTRRVVPAKKSVKVISDWHPKNGFPSVAANGWTLTGAAAYNSSGRYVEVGGTTGSFDMNKGVLAASVNLPKFVHDFKVTVKVSAKTAGPISYMGSTYMPKMTIYAAWTVNGTTYYYHPDFGWTTNHVDGEEHELRNTNDTNDITLAETIEATFPSKLDANSGFITVNVQGAYIDVYDIDVQLVTNKGYEDNIIIDNGARGTAAQISISGGRELSSYLIPADFMRGVFYTESGGVATEITSFADNDNSGKDYMSLTALNYAKCVAAPRIEISGTLDLPATRVYQPLVIKSHGVWALLSSYEWDLYNADINFKAITLPTATLTVDEENITSR